MFEVGADGAVLLGDTHGPLLGLLVEAGLGIVLCADSVNLPTPTICTLIIVCLSCQQESQACMTHTRNAVCSALTSLCNGHHDDKCLGI